MSSATDEIQKPPPLLLQGVVPNPFQSRKPLRRHVTTMNASSRTKDSAPEALAEAQAELEQLKLLLHDRDLELTRLRSDLAFAHVHLRDVTRQVSSIGRSHAVANSAIDQLQGFLRSVINE
ncbi:hypothetical protein C8R45DRAFT_1114384 [Mycena sanguinolenta]|nr:hypothetical protein C8R45DRAFT_1114384 [Mycena sanguinolenta]